jgi:hypothetical protein
LISPITTALTILLIIHQSGSITSWIFMRPNGSNDDQFEDQLKMFDVEINQWKMALENLWLDNEVQKNNVWWCVQTVGCGVIAGVLVFTEWGALGSIVVAASPLWLQPGLEPASAVWIPTPPIIRNELTARNAIVAKRVVLLLFIL